ncbi:MAG: tetratricopeptide repeat protein, partial [Longimicrobiaceae bacterium]
MSSLSSSASRLCPALLGAALLALAGCRAQPGDGSELLEVLLGERFTAGRVSGASGWAPCTVTDSAGIVPRLVCGDVPAPGTPRFERLAAAARRAGREPTDSTPTALRSMALLDLRWRASSPAGVERAIETLERAARRAPRDPAVLNDLAVAYLAQGERDQQLAP